MDGTAADTGRTRTLDDLAKRLAKGGDSRLGRGLLMAVDRLLGLVEDLSLTPDELRAVIEFLTEVGQASDARRQEWVLLADVLGLSTLVEDRHRPAVAGATPVALAGPFYRADMPDLPDGADLSRDGLGTPLSVAFAVRATGGDAIPHAMVEVWHANTEGIYENQEPDRQPEFNLRGRFRAGDDGRVRFRTIRPRGLTLPEDGPVGRLMNRLGLRLVRPAHLHVRITAPGHATLVTHIFDRADPAIRQDALFGVKPALLADFCPEGAGFRLDYTFVLTPLATA